MSGPHESHPPYTWPFDFTAGAELIGLGVALILYGASTGQLLWYFRRSEGVHATGFPACYVVLLWLLGTTQAIITSYQMGKYTVSGRGDPDAVYGSTKTFATCIAVSVLTSGMVRFGYLYRIWSYTHNRLLIGLVVGVILSALAMILSLVATAYIAQMNFVWEIGRGINWTFYISNGAEIVVDLMIAVIVFTSLLQFHTGLTRFDLLIRAIMVFVFSTGVLAVFLTACSIIVFSLLPGAFLFNGALWVLSQLHICSFFAVLNIEKELANETLIHLARDSRTSVAVQLTTRVDVGSFAGTQQLSVDCTDDNRSTDLSLASTAVTYPPSTCGPKVWASTSTIRND
ncbi:uncharacterized protein BXZ73DRAFT_105917 [Epithele typhae]|uniref:uncharacterized protein n=1 Tax=Epithele typhae TaxID=378194 RepID=UPI002008B705|nr:uncharacterized protein BXZ73DRAFT_105917 [Epithele typhae]KAH9916290.1 hypothetical protein BXZ73DRAFT_105917 [Epithele typhae]